MSGLSRIRMVAGPFVLVAVLVGLLGASAISLSSSQTEGRSVLRSRFGQRAQIAANFVNAYLSDFSRRETRLVDRSLAGDQLTEGDFERIVAGLQVDAAVYLDVRGRLVHVWPRNDAVVGHDLTVKYPHLAAAHRGQRARFASGTQRRPS